MYNRGNNRTTIFHDERDYRSFLMTARRSSRLHGVAVHGFVLMTNHYHLLVTSSSEDALPLAMKRIGERYSRYFNDRYTRTGTLWEGRYQARPIDGSADLLTCLRYIEHNPVKAAMVKRAEAYRWSSFGVHALGQPSDWLVPHASYTGLGATASERQWTYRAICGEPIPDDVLARIRHRQR